MPTELERIAYELMSNEADIVRLTPKEKQKLLDHLTPEIIGLCSPEDLIAHTSNVYSDTAEEYSVAYHNQGIIDDLVPFMNLLPDNADIRDIGCGPFRDGFFMSISNPKFRESQMQRVSNGMTTFDKYKIPKKKFRVTGIDNAKAMIEKAKAQHAIYQGMNLFPTGTQAPVLIEGDFLSMNPATMGQCDAIWSCTGLFTHTPREWIARTVTNVAGHLKNGGLFFTSYTARGDDDPYNKLLFSATGRIKWFSHQRPDAIAAHCQMHNLILKSQSFSDLERDGKVVARNLFVNQLFVKVEPEAMAA